MCEKYVTYDQTLRGKNIFIYGACYNISPLLVVRDCKIHVVIQRSSDVFYLGYYVQDGDGFSPYLVWGLGLARKL